MRAWNLIVGLVIGFLAGAILIGYAGKAAYERRTSILEDRLIAYSVDDTMRSIGVCLWRDRLHQDHRDDVWIKDAEFRADVGRWCGHEPYRLLVDGKGGKRHG